MNPEEPVGLEASTSGTSLRDAVFLLGSIALLVGLALVLIAATHTVAGCGGP